MKTLLMLIMLTFSLGSLSTTAEAAQKKRAPKQAAVKKGSNRAPASATQNATAAKKPAEAPRKKEINFEERILEGLGDRGYESLSQTGNLDPAARDRLYRKRAEFDEESQYLLREMEYLK